MTELVQYALLGLGAGGLYALLGLGMVLIHRGSGVINFAHGGFVLAGAYLAYDARVRHGQPFSIAALTAIAGVAAIGVAVHFLIMRPLRHASPLIRVIATLGLLTVLTEAVTLKFGTANQVVPAPLPADPVDLGSGVIVGRQAFYLVAIAIVVGTLLLVLATRTRLGYALSASAENPRAAAALGWSPDLLAAFTWGVGGALAGLAGALFPAVTAGFLSADRVAVLVVATLATALVAQFRSYLAAVLGGIAIGILQALTTRYLTQTGLADSVPFLVIIFLLVIRGRGLPLRGTLSDKLPRVGTGDLRPAVALPSAATAVLAVVFFIPDEWDAPLTVSLTFAIMGLSVVVLTGYTGQLSLAQVAIGGAGAFAAGYLVAAHNWPFELALPAGVLAAMVVGCILGIPALRTRGVNLAVVTFGLGFTVSALLFGNSDYTLPASDLSVEPLTFFGWGIDPINHAGRYSVVCLVALLLTGLMVTNLRRGRSGRRLLAVRTNERAAAAIGVNVFQTKLYAFTVASGIAGLGGTLLGFSYTTLQYQQVFMPSASVSLLVVVVIGGVGYVLGPMLGSVLVAGGLAIVFSQDLESAGTETSSAQRFLPLATGIILLVVLLISQHGVVERIGAVARARIPTRLKQPAPLPGLVTDRARVNSICLTVTGLTQRFGGFMALSDVDLEVRPGEVVGLLGPNGAGKTTLIDGITGYNRLSAGRVTLDGVDVTAWSPYRRARAGLTRSFQTLELFDDLTVKENLLAAADRRDLKAYLTDLVRPGRAVLPDTVVAAVAELKLAEVLDKRPEDLSYGQRRLVAIARAIAARPSILLLDEPAAGLDEHESAELGHLIRKLADEWGIGVLLIEHDVDMVLETADRVVVLDFGRKIAEGAPDEISSNAEVRRAYLGDDDTVTQVHSP